MAGVGVAGCEVGGAGWSGRGQGVKWEGQAGVGGQGVKWEGQGAREDCVGRTCSPQSCES